MEDNIGHLVSFVNGTTDVLEQCMQKYLLEKNLYIQLKKSSIASDFYQRIQSKLKFSKSELISNVLVVGEKFNNLSFKSDEKAFIKAALKLESEKNIYEYGSVIISKKLFYESKQNNLIYRKRTNDFFVCTSFDNAEIIGEIISIFVVNLNVYFLIQDKYIASNE